MRLTERRAVVVGESPVVAEGGEHRSGDRDDRRERRDGDERPEQPSTAARRGRLDRTPYAQRPHLFVVGDGREAVAGAIEGWLQRVRDVAPAEPASA